MNRITAQTQDKRPALCIRLSSLGDVINTLPAVAELSKKYRIHYLTESAFADLTMDNPCIERTIIFPITNVRRYLRMPFHWPWLYKLLCGYISSLRSIEYEVVYDFHSCMKSALNVLFVRAMRSRGFGPGDCYERAHVLYDELVSTGGGRMHRQDKFALLAGARLANAVRIPMPPIPRGSLDAARDFIGKNALKNFILIHPGVSRKGSEKQWGAGNWVSLINKVFDRFGARSVLTWGGGEERLANSIAARCRHKAISYLRTGTLNDLRAIISHAALFVSCDTGPLHLACADERPAIGLYGPKDPAVYAPRSKNFHLICPATGRMRDIDPAEVAEKVGYILAQSGKEGQR